MNAIQDDRRVRSAFESYLRNGRRIRVGPARGALADSAIATKFNPYHDPDDGRFTFAPGNGPGNDSRTRRARTGSGPRAAPAAPPGPLRRHAAKGGEAGAVARAVNSIVAKPNAVETIRLGGNKVTIRRSGPGAVTLSMAGGLFKAAGRFAVVPDRAGVAIAIGKLGVSAVARGATSVKSFPRRITIFETRDGRLAYSIDRPIVIRVFKKTITRKTGIHYIGE